MSRDRALILALLLVGSGALANRGGLIVESQLVLSCAGLVCLAAAVRLAMPLALVGAAAVAVALDQFIEPSEETAEWIVIALILVWVLPAAVYDFRDLRERSS